MSCWAHLGCWDEIDAEYRSISSWYVTSISKSCWSSSSSEFEMLDNKFVSANGSKGFLMPLSASNRSCGCTRSECGIKCEKSYLCENELQHLSL